MKKCGRIVLGIVVALVSASILTSCQTNRLGTRIFRENPELYFSKSKIEKTAGIPETFELTVIDVRNDFVSDFRGNKNETSDFFKGSLDHSIRTKIIGDGVFALQDQSPNKITIKVRSFYMGMFGFFFVSGRAVIDLSITTLIDGKSDSYDIQEIYETDGSDKEYEGSTVDTIENAANVTLGMTLRRAIDKIYARISA